MNRPVNVNASNAIISCHPAIEQQSSSKTEKPRSHEKRKKKDRRQNKKEKGRVLVGIIRKSNPDARLDMHRKNGKKTRNASDPGPSRLWVFLSTIMNP